MLNDPVKAATNVWLAPAELENLLIYLKQTHGVNLTGYKRASLLRRTMVRMQGMGVEHYQAYLDRLQQDPGEVKHLLDTIYVNHTLFFRDPVVWHYLAEQVIPQILANQAPEQPIRVWSVGCATGEETYSLAVLLVEALGIEQFQRRVRIWGTDVDTDAILQARQGHYAAHKLAAMPPALRDRHFDCEEAHCHWRRSPHPSISFFVQNIITHSPLPAIDLLVCRNLLIYLTMEAQLKALAAFYLSLKGNGFLLLGRAEYLVTPSQRALFTPLHRQNRVFTKVFNVNQSSLLASWFRSTDIQEPN